MVVTNLSHKCTESLHYVTRFLSIEYLSTMSDSTIKGTIIQKLAGRLPCKSHMANLLLFARKTLFCMTFATWLTVGQAVQLSITQCGLQSHLPSQT